jgi:NAD(P)-dependent dehydrogenase (short-subunit alcohol dehydrogenase family)
VDAVVANAGVMASGGVEDMDLDELRRVIEVNLRGTWLTLRSSTPHLARAGG